jgi:hypothetical protein
VEIYAEELQEQIRHTSALFHVSGIIEGGIGLLGHLEIKGCYTNGKPDIFYTWERKYLEMPLVKYYIFDYIYDTVPDGKDGLKVIKVIKDVRVFDNNELLGSLGTIPYTSPYHIITAVIEHNLFFSELVMSYIRVDVIYNSGEEDSFYTNAFNYRDLPIFEEYMFDYLYDTIFGNSLKSETFGILHDSLKEYGINDDLVNVKVITNIRKALKGWPSRWRNLRSRPDE